MKTLQEQLSLTGKTALVTGGAGYLGSSISETLAELGADVIIASRNLQKCREWCEKLRRRFPSIQATPLKIDLIDPHSVQLAFETIHQQTSGLDILVNNAWSGRKSSLESATEESWRHDLEMSLTSVFRCVRHAIPGLKKKRGVILNITSMYGHVAPDYRLYQGNQHVNPPGYGAAKAGVIQLSKYMASFLSPYGIRVNCLSPGPFPHPEAQQDKVFMQRLAERNPLGRIGQPEELKGAVALMCSDASSYMTGQHLSVDGGWSIW
ncbi:SDR family NAD(P)-dependent oxidoreductase [Desmospora profundinema]|uniref:Gluconate 5-dehydrogenase n=1 Tax=Desmospora profundinema TaxID=1571184 RepID=A0ABU1ISF7_9BACL|nr:SDR family oxidoreductase [Desmospora profundinema]MDR6227497.1 gluconate 5-dehydrogenase [Desmospora profundinema]